MLDFSGEPDDGGFAIGLDLSASSHCIKDHLSQQFAQTGTMITDRR